jgi:hypothetical protein
VPWAHVFFSEKTMLRTCRRVYNAPWYRPTQWDFDDNGRRKDKYGEEAIDTDWLNKLLLRDFEELFDRSGFEYKMVLQPFGSRHARWTRVFLRNRFLREYVTSFFWALLKKGR